MESIGIEKIMKNSILEMEASAERIFEIIVSSGQKMPPRESFEVATKKWIFDQLEPAFQMALASGKPRSEIELYRDMLANQFLAPFLARLDHVERRYLESAGASYVASAPH